MKESTFVIIKKILKIIIFIVVVTTFIVFGMLAYDNKQIKNIKEFIKNDTKVLYISDDSKFSEYPIELFNKYEISYLYISSDDLNTFEKNKIEKIINSKYLSNIIVVFKDGNLIDAIIDYETENNLNIFLQNLEIIPEVIGSIEGMIESVPELLDSDSAILYFPYKYVDGIENQNKILEYIAKEYDAQYKMINAYLLSNVQQEKLNSILQISAVEDQIIILVKNGKIINSIRGINTVDEYLNKLYDCEFIDSIENDITNIGYDEFKDLLNLDEKNIIIIGKDNCKYCDEVIANINSISINYHLKIYYLNIGEFGSDISNNLEDDLLELGYDDGFTTPLTILIESNKLLDYVIGSSSEKYFVDIFTENGIIK